MQCLERAYFTVVASMRREEQYKSLAVVLRVIQSRSSDAS